MTEAVQADIEALRQFRERLRRFSQETDKSLGSLRTNLQQLRAGWKDARGQDYERAFEQVAKQIQATNTAIDKQHLKYLDGAIRILEEFNKQRVPR